MGAFEELGRQKSEMEEKIRSQGEKALAEYFRDRFGEAPGLHGVQWEQYTPYFNDGDECVFHIREPEFDVTGDGEYLDEWSLKRKDLNGSVLEAMDQISHDLYANEDLLKFALGDHTSVTATRDGIAVTTYEDHD